MGYDENYIKEMLKTYNLLKMQCGMLCKASIISKEIKELEYLDSCIECLTEEYKIIIRDVCINKATIHSAAKQLHISTKTISRIRDKAIKIIAESFNKNISLRMSETENKKLLAENK